MTDGGAESAAGSLYIVSTPIGNLGDMTHRGVEVLRSVARIVAEDTRHSRTLLDRYDIRTPVSSYHEHNEASETPRIVALLESGESVALVSDAGTPLLSDPGRRLVDACIAASIDVVPVPGASALLAALVASGMPAIPFTFHGFLARKGNERRDSIREIADSRHTSVLYESPQRLSATLAELTEAGCGARKCVVARELTKKFETFERGTVNGLLSRFETAPRGEIVIAISGAEPDAPPDDESAIRIARELRESGASPRDVMKTLVEDHRIARNTAYRIAHDGAGTNRVD